MSLSNSGNSPHHELTLEIYQDGEKLTGAEAKAYRTKLTLALLKLVGILSIVLVTLGAVLGVLATAAFGDDYGRSYVRGKYTIDTPKEAVGQSSSSASAPTPASEGREVSATNPPFTIRNPQSSKNPSVVRVTGTEGNSTSYGSGTVVAHLGDRSCVLTCWHVVQDAAKGSLKVHLAGRTYKGIVTYRDTANDLAVIDIAPIRAPAVAINVAEPTGPLRAIGFGKGAYRETTGSLNSKVLAKGATSESLVVRAFVRQGDSGGPLLNQAGELVGVVWGSRLRSTYATSARPLAAVKAWLQNRGGKQTETNTTAATPTNISKSASPEPAEPASVPVALAWRPSFAHAATDAKRTGKPIWIHFTMSQGCGPCIAYERQVLGDAVFVAVANELTTPVRVDVLTDEGQKLAQRFGVDKVPTDVLLTPQQDRFYRERSQHAPQAATEWIRHSAPRYTERSVVVPINSQRRSQ